MITDRDRKFIDIAYAHSKSIDGMASARVTALIVYKNRIIAFGINRNKTHPLQAKYARRADAIFLHAEVDCIKNALREIDVDDFSRCTMYVARAKYAGVKKSAGMVIGMAKPCSGCTRAINTFGIGRVVYTTDEQTIVKM